MARPTNKLTATIVKNASFSGNPQKISDGGGLFLHIQESGKYWRMKFRFAGSEKLMALGVYPQVSLKEAREKHQEAKKLLAEGINPVEYRIATRSSSDSTFKAISEEYLSKQHDLSERTIKKSKWLLNQLTPRLGHLPINEITAPQLLNVLRKIEEQGKNETAHRANQKASQVFRYAISCGKASRDPTADLRGALAKIKTKNQPAIINPKEIGQLLRDIDGYQGKQKSNVKEALQLAALLFVRPSELRMMKWENIDLDNHEWRIPAEDTKMNTPHLVPLAKQAVTILESLLLSSKPTGFVFPSIRTSSRPMSENTINAALRSLGYTKDEMVGHGFRAMASTRLNEMGIAVDVIERQLAHQERNKVRAAYNRAEYIAERKSVMQIWADHLDELRND